MTIRRDSVRPTRIKISPIPPEEWDFRKVPETFLKWAVFWEYARSADWFRRQIEDWHQETFQLATTLPEFKRYGGRKIYTVLAEYRKGTLPKPVAEHLFNSLPDGTDEYPFTEIFPLFAAYFPDPFSSLPEPDDPVTLGFLNPYLEHKCSSLEFGHFGG